MVVGVMRVQLAIEWSRSLKDKRQVVRSLKDSLHRHHQVSVAEVEDLEILNRATLGISAAGNDGAYIGSVLDRVLGRIRSVPDCEVTGTSREILHGWVGALGGSHAGVDDLSDEGLEEELARRALDEMNRGHDGPLSDEPLSDEPISERRV